MAKFKELPKKEQEGYVIAYTNAIKVKTYQLCYRDIGEALKKLKEDDKDALSIEATIKRKDGSSSTEESIKASAKDVIPVIEALVKSGRYFSKNHDYQTLGDVVVKESQSLNMIPDDFITEELVDYAIESKKYLNIRDIPSKFMTARRFVTICKKDRSAVNWLFQYVDILSDEELLEVLCANSDGLSNVPAERWNKELLYHYLEYCVRNYKDTGFMDYMAKLPEELKDKVYYQCCCMTGGFYYSKIPEEMKKTVISWKLVTETIRRWDIAQKEGCLISYNGLGWMLQFLPIEFRTKEVCIEVCKRYPYAIEHVPNKIIEDDSFWEELLRNEYFAPLLQLEKKQIKHLSKKYLELKKEVNVVDEIGRGTFKPKSEEEWKLLLNRHGEKILDIPENFLSAEMLLIAMRSNSYVVEKNTGVIDKLSEPDKKLFWNMVVKERLFTKPISVPSEYMSKEVICDWVKGKYCYDAKDIPKAYHTEDVLLELAKAHPDRFTYDYDIQTQRLIDTIMSLAEKDICKAIYLKKVRPDLRRKSLIDELCLTVPREMLSLDSISKEQIDVILSHSPDLIIDTPMWYIRELRSGKQNKDTGKPALEANNIPHMDAYTNAPIKKQIESPDIMIDDWTQISIFDILAAQ
jgi:hypothetical protein